MSSTLIARIASRATVSLSLFVLFSLIFSFVLSTSTDPSGSPSCKDPTCSEPKSDCPPNSPCEKCSDDSDQCQTWASHGECKKNPSYMRRSCTKSCGLCTASLEAVDVGSIALELLNTTVYDQWEKWLTAGTASIGLLGKKISQSNKELRRRTHQNASIEGVQLQDHLALIEHSWRVQRSLLDDKIKQVIFSAFAVTQGIIEAEGILLCANKDEAKETRRRIRRHFQTMLTFQCSRIQFLVGKWTSNQRTQLLGTDSQLDSHWNDWILFGEILDAFVTSSVLPALEDVRYELMDPSRSSTTGIHEQIMIKAILAVRILGFMANTHSEFVGRQVVHELFYLGKRIAFRLKPDDDDPLSLLLGQIDENGTGFSGDFILAGREAVVNDLVRFITTTRSRLQEPPKSPTHHQKDNCFIFSRLTFAAFTEKNNFPDSDTMPSNTREDDEEKELVMTKPPGLDFIIGEVQKGSCMADNETVIEC